MGVTLKTSERELNKKFKEAEQSMINDIVRVLRYCGEMAVNEARNNGNCTDAKSLVAEASIIYDFLK